MGTHIYIYNFNIDSQVFNMALCATILTPVHLTHYILFKIILVFQISGLPQILTQALSSAWEVLVLLCVYSYVSLSTLWKFRFPTFSCQDSIILFHIHITNCTCLICSWWYTSPLVLHNFCAFLAYYLSSPLGCGLRISILSVYSQFPRP